MLKWNLIFLQTLISKDFSHCIDTREFPNGLKRIEFDPVNNKKNMCVKENNKPDSILLTLSNVYEKLMCNQLYDYLENVLFA